MKINLVLSGGGVRGFAHLGVIKALSSYCVEINAISGTSSGAVVGAFMAAGYSPDETLELMKQYDMLKLLRSAFKAGLFSMRNFEKIYNRCFHENLFEALNFPLALHCERLNPCLVGMRENESVAVVRRPPVDLLNAVS